MPYEKKEDRDPAVITYALYLYFNSRSFRLAAKSLAAIKRRSHVAIWKWVQRYADVADRFRTDRRLARAIFVDETLLQIDGRDYGLWIAYEPAMDACVWPCTCLVRGPFSCVLPLLQAAAEKVWQ